MCVCVYICIYIHTYIHIYISVCVSMHLCVSGNLSSKKVCPRHCKPQNRALANNHLACYPFGI